MSLHTRVRWMITVSSLGLAPLYAQTTPANQTMGTNPASKPAASSTMSPDHHGQMENHGMETKTSKTSTTTSTSSSTTMTSGSSMGHHGHHGHHGSMGSSSKSAVWRDTTRLSAVLQDSQAKVTVPAATWTVVANEANTLANRIYGHTAGNSTARTAAKNLRMHVREMRSAAMKGDADGARMHASEAMPFASTLIEWSAPAKM